MPHLIYNPIHLLSINNITYVIILWRFTEYVHVRFRTFCERFKKAIQENKQRELLEKKTLQRQKQKEQQQATIARRRADQIGMEY